MKKTVIVGHRGAGKSALLKRWQAFYQPEASFYDLDLEIEKKAGQSISKIFETQGEAAFRLLEKSVFQDLLQNSRSDVIIAVGGGFDVSLIPSDAHTLWVRRDSDSEGRIFLNRPRLEKSVDPLEEYKVRFQNRDPKFQNHAESVYTLPEGLMVADTAEKKIVLQETFPIQAFLTLTSRHLKWPPHYQDCVFEIRDDLLSPEEIQKALTLFPAQQLLYSVRSNRAIPQVVFDLKIKIDCDTQFLSTTSLNPAVVSTHENQIHKAMDALKAFENLNHHLKLCPLAQTWDELWQGFQWMKLDPENRSFLPRSLKGDWAWFRLFLKGQQWINFIREDQGSSDDQPTVWEWISTPSKPERFAAVLGSPIRHSFSPPYHKNFFAEYGMPIFKIPVEKNQWVQAIDVLEKLGLQAAAVTAPLKENAGAFVGQAALNTLVKTAKGWLGTNTDTAGLRSLLADETEKTMAVWGGGGVLGAVRAVLPKAPFYSVRTGKPREGSPEISHPQVVVWAAPESSLENLPASWQPVKVIDLNYKQNSEGLIYAEKVKAQYVSGLKMFEVQAQEQQKFWRTYVGK